LQTLFLESIPRSIAGPKFPTHVLRRSVECFSYLYFRGRERPLLYHEACAKWLSDENPTSSTSEVMYSRDQRF
jgi:hypothetical protein